MNLLKKLFAFYIYSSVHVALAAMSLAWVTLLELGLGVDKVVLCFVFFATISGYNFVKIYGLGKFYKERFSNWLQWIHICSLFSFIMMCYYGLHLKLQSILVMGVFAVLTFFYAIPFLRGKTRNLRQVEGLKVFIIALVWMGVCVFLPVINEDYGVTQDVLLMGIQRFTFVLVMMLPFEIRDLKYDPLNLETIPQKIGVKKTKVLGQLLLAFILVLECFKTQFSFSRMGVLGAVVFVTGMMVWLSRIEQQKYYASFWVEALPIFWLLLGLIVF
ncbi:hypothetical protein Q4566_11795 [Tamlana sp. 2_MG-2023]|uniref:hypothetical protein n=1 Tax=unclassified Tamlana TaxID=2614803 RepID=UPI0026E39873|nr:MULTISPECIES: hypothetical protein [unclassified Tamlana]MDO6760886.1 hypothetical protein [Tamlana sp. 2_MG-2023]MDO6791142.1 hypothetical protein [Tamlana sp. 1_MG-2023]